MSLGLHPHRVVANDVNEHLINFYRCVQQGFLIDTELENDHGYYYAAREEFNRLISAGTATGPRAAELFYYLNRTGFNGLCRFNKQGLYNVSFGQYRTINYQRDLSALGELTRGWEFHSGDFESLEVEPGDFIYADPPYDVPFRQYAPDGFDWHSQVRLAEWLSRHDGSVVVSHQATERAVALYERLGFELAYLDGPRRISRTGDRTPAREILGIRGVAERRSAKVRASAAETPRKLADQMVRGLG